MSEQKRLIDANALAEKVWNISMYIFGVRNGKTLIKEFLEKYRDSVMKEIAVAPIVDAVEVVRCKDCKHWDDLDIKSHLPNHGTCWKCMLKTNKDHFCAYGER